MDNELYRQLQKHLHKQPAGFPETENGSEIDILKRFYTPEQAKIALKMTNIPEPPAKIAKRLKMGAKKAGESLEQMAKEGLLFRIHTPEAPLYAQPNFIMGIYEWHVNMVDREIAEKVDHVYDGLFEKHWKDKKVKQLRVVPVEKSRNWSPAKKMSPMRLHRVSAGWSRKKKGHPATGRLKPVSCLEWLPVIILKTVSAAS
jgi:hypothetical protein